MTEKKDYIPLEEQENPMEIDINSIDPASFITDENEDLRDQFGNDEDWIEVKVTGTLDQERLETFERLYEQQVKNLK